MSVFSPVLNFYNNGFHPCSGSVDIPVTSPVDGRRLATLSFSTEADLEKAVASAAGAFPVWSGMSIRERAQVFYRYKNLLHEHATALAQLIHEENGKTVGEAIAEIEKSIEVTEFACSLPQMMTGELQEVSKGVECRMESVPLGVVACITPFNFPLMVPHWTIPIAITLGNCMILKPSEKVPLSAMKMAELLKQAGLPAGVFNIIHGGSDIAESICNHPRIEAVSFVGSTAVARQVYRTATHALKKCLALGGAKNHLLVLPDALPEMTSKNILASMSGCAGQRCMAASAMIAVGSVQHIIDKLCEEARKLVPGRDIGAVISREAKERIEHYISEAESEGAQVLVDGRNTVVTGSEEGYYVGPTVIDWVNPGMRIAREEVFGPVICITRTATLQEALKIENANKYGNATSVFTQDGAMAKQVIERANAGMVGVNIGVPVPREPFSFGGWNESKFGSGDITGKSSTAFWSKLKKSTVKWQAEAGINWMS